MTGQSFTEVATSAGRSLVDLTRPARADSGRADSGRADSGRARGPRFLLALTHGAGGSVSAPDLLAARDAALRAGGAVALVTQPYRVKGARAPGSAVRQDEAWCEIIAALRGGPRPMLGSGIPLIVGGRSNGARVACRTAAAVQARGVIALAFPLRPPPRRRGELAGTGASITREAELRMAASDGASVLVVNGDRDPFGIPEADDLIRVVALKGETHTLSRNPAAIADAVTGWLADVVPQKG
jgi:uncharacterized protein